ncbi:hypothetical protein AGMMS50233_06200 [Endomicrobiia bacterium]|nr:hypothetical protein AGMMS50233_06200 [Endomicrobiia bacterium]
MLNKKFIAIIQLRWVAKGYMTKNRRKVYENENRGNVKRDCVICSCDKKNVKLINRRHATPKIEEIKEAKRAKAQAAADAEAQQKAEAEQSIAKSIYIADPESLVGGRGINAFQLHDPNAGPSFGRSTTSAKARNL